MPYTHSVTDKETPMTENAPAYQILMSVRLTSMCPHNKLSNTCCGNAEWMRVIHSINRELGERWEEHGLSTPTSTYEQSGGRWFEEYPEFRVVLLAAGNGGYVQAKTPEAASDLRRAVKEVTGRDVDQNGMAI
jgi:hypothetical protein